MCLLLWAFQVALQLMMQRWMKASSEMVSSSLADLFILLLFQNDVPVMAGPM
jgi:hypothetical protein